MILTNSRGGQIVAEGESVEALKRLGWEEASNGSKPKEASPTPAKAKTTSAAQPRKTDNRK